jgi:hypothetical protein
MRDAQCEPGGNALRRLLIALISEITLAWLPLVATADGERRAAWRPSACAPGCRSGP